MFGQNRCLISVGNKYGYIDTLGKVAIKPQYSYGLQFSEGLAAVKNDTAWGFIDSSGKVVIEFKFNIAEQFNGGSSVVNINGKSGLIDKKGKIILEPIYDWIYFQNEGFVASKLNGKWGFYHITSRKFITDFIYEDVGPFSNGLAAVKIDNLYGFINRNGVIAIEPKYRQIRYKKFGNGLACAVSPDNNKWGVIDTLGNVIMDFKYFDLSFPSENKIFVREKYKQKGYFINQNGEKLFNKTFDDIWIFNDGLCAVRINGKEGIINSEGKWIVEPNLDGIGILYHDGWISFHQIGDSNTRLYGIINRQGEIVFKPQFSRVIKNDGNCILPEVYLCGKESNKNINLCKRGYVNLKGDIIWKPTK